MWISIKRWLNLNVEFWCKFGATLYAMISNGVLKTQKDNYYIIEITALISVGAVFCCRGDLRSPAGERSSPLRCRMAQFVKTLQSYLLLGALVI